MNAQPAIPEMMSADKFELETVRELAGSEPRSPRFRIARFGTIKPDISAQYLVKGLLQSTGLAVVWGAPKCGKSFWTFDLLMHVALDRPYRGRRVTAGVVVYCALEGVQGFKNRIEAFRRARMAEADDGNPPFYLMATPLSLVRDQKSFIAEIGQQLGEQKPVAVCIDTLNRSLAGSESSDEDMTAYGTPSAAWSLSSITADITAIVHAAIPRSWARSTSKSLCAGTQPITSWPNLSCRRMERPGCNLSLVSRSSRSAPTRTAIRSQAVSSRPSTLRQRLPRSPQKAGCQMSK